MIVKLQENSIVKWNIWTYYWQAVKKNILSIITEPNNRQTVNPTALSLINIYYK